MKYYAPVILLFVLSLLCTGVFSGCGIEYKNPDDITVSRKELRKITYEWAVYKEIAIVAYAKIHNVSKDDARIHLEYIVETAVEKEFLTRRENEDKWGMK